MVICNRELIKTIESKIEIPQAESEIENKPCENLNPNADLIDYKTKKDQLHFYEKDNFEPCNDLWLISNEEALWQCIVGEIKTPLGDLVNSIGQADYGCRIWEFIGEPLDSLNIKAIESYIIDTCLKYPEVENVINIESYIGDNDGYYATLTIDSIYGVFDGKTHIPMAYTSNKAWKKSGTTVHRQN